MRIFLPFLFVLGVFVLSSTGCSSSEKSSDEVKVEPAPAAPAPGTASVEAEVLSFSESDGKCKLKILKVLEYGSSTPPLAENTELETVFSKRIMEENQIESGKVYKLLLSGSSMEGEGSAGWKVSKINK